MINGAVSDASNDASNKDSTMKWKYYIPHVWESPESRTVWEDVWLLPEDGSNDGKSYWFTLNALTFGAAGIEGEYPVEGHYQLSPG